WDGLEVEYLTLGGLLTRFRDHPGTVDLVAAGSHLAGAIVDAAAHLAGSLHTVARGWLGETGPGVFAADLCDADEVAGLGVADPAGTLLAATLLLSEGLGARSAARTLERAVAAAEQEPAPDTRSFTVDVIFGIPGGAILPTYDAMARGTTVRHVLARHEQGAGHMAEGYARASGKVGVAIATSGPGATNLVTAIADAWMDSTPLVCITGQVRSSLIGTDAFQEIDITGITMPIVKHSWLVQDVGELPGVLRAAFH